MHPPALLIDFTHILCLPQKTKKSWTLLSVKCKSLQMVFMKVQTCVEAVLLHHILSNIWHRRWGRS